MRDPTRIPKVLKLLHIYWQANPDLRLGQLLSNAGVNHHTEDDRLVEYLQHKLRVINV